jgi:Uma2 family endonuclease
MDVPKPPRPVTVGEYLAMERASKERHEYLDGRIIPMEHSSMGLPQPKTKQLVTIGEYLALERAAEERHEYLDGQIIAMAGESDAHGIITVNLVISLGNQLKGTPCQARTKDTKVRSGPTLMSERASRGLFCYPDVVVVCGEPQYHDTAKDVLLNPKALVEVLSPATEAFDRGEKFTRHQTYNASLSDYILVCQDRPQIEHFVRQPDGSRSYDLYTGLDCSCRIASIGCTLKLADVYDRVTFPPQTDMPAPM